MHRQTADLNRRLILNAMTSIEAWESWASEVPVGPAATLNQSLIRLTKGLIKAWRLYLIERGTEENSSTRNVLPPANNNPKQGEEHV